MGEKLLGHFIYRASSEYMQRNYSIVTGSACVGICSLVLLLRTPWPYYHDAWQTLKGGERSTVAYIVIVNYRYGVGIFVMR